MAERAIERITTVVYKVFNGLSFLPPLLSRFVIGYSFFIAGSPKVGPGSWKKPPAVVMRIGPSTVSGATSR